MKAIRNLLFIPFGLIIGLTVDGFEQPRPAGTTMAAIRVSMAWGDTAASERVPFVPCETSAFNGEEDLPAPEDSGQAPELPRPVALKLAYYASALSAVLAPRGWHCHSYGQSGSSTLVVAPEPVSADDVEHPTGPGIFRLSATAWTGGGLEVVVDVAARLFPAKKKLVQGLLGEWQRDKSEYTFGPYPDDILTRRSDTDVEFETPANKDGMGTYGFVKNADPIRGMAILSELTDGKDKYPSIVLLDVRMPPGMRPLVRTIMEYTRWDVRPVIHKGQ
jgi:hypothetical protein